MPVASYISPKAAKGEPSAIAGRGLVAVAPIAKDEIVAVKGGHVVDTATLRSRRPELRRRYRGYFSWYPQRRIDESTVDGTAGGAG